MGIPQGHHADRQTHPHRASAVDERAFDTLFRTYFDPLCRYVYRYVGAREEAEDVVHDLFVRVWERRGELAGVGDVATYLYSAARNRALSHLRHRAVEGRWRDQAGQEASASSATAAAHPAPLGDPERQLLSAEIRAAVQRALDDLAPRQKDVVVRRWRGESYEAIAAALGISVSTVSVHMTRALTHLRAALVQFL